MELTLEIGKFVALGVALLTSVIGISTDFRTEGLDGKKRLTNFGYLAIALSIVAVGLAGFLSVIEKKISARKAIEHERMEAVRGIEQQRLENQRELHLRLQNSTLHAVSFTWVFEDVPDDVLREYKEASDQDPHEGLEDLTVRLS